MKRHGKAGLVLVVAALGLVGCADAESAATGSQCPAIAGGVPPSKLILPPSGGIPGQYVVVLDAGVDVATTADELAGKYGGLVQHLFAQPPGFSVSLADAQAPALAQEACVCWVEQDAGVTIPP